ncbi:bifunctional 6-phosphofructo-2-kinase/fructose-2,6-bisphosphate 2-phosphatase [Piedraia hortae CBS 480.64]|uniref:Bifunctional 6-phosphofructo-2-kinase/fructose-2,6-bisphosphate 2-phosphatase n=1 Tax=Piedraia hortae CBS 480.64 TaxID=1314780 RepID=A0A6A7BQF3_9PEZI|nr:bifunctional 6-phosphofructo-2-kinase/fructose-2,6-bisphosphate 2-phosphatase [Piedraia hortae CBS 480.64]
MSHSTEAAAASSGASTPSTSSVVSNIHSSGRCSCTTPDDSDLGQFRRRQSLLLAKQMEAKCATNVDSTNVDVFSSITIALNDTPATTAPSSPYAKGAQEPMAEMAKLLLPQGALASSGTSTPRSRPTTLDIPGLTKSKVSPDGRIASRDVGSKLVIVMVGLPARGKSYITKKLARYLNWLQHDTRIFNVGERRRQDGKDEQNAAWFDPDNKKASAVREQLARETLDELLNYILNQNGSVGILDATNSTMERRKMVMDCIRERAGPDLNVLFLESRCVDQDLLEANMRLKLNGPDYKGMDPHVALADFKQRVKAYEKAYVPLGDYEEKHNMPYIQMIDVGRKVISHQIKGFLMAQANYYLLNFNLAPRQIWITRHGLSLDNMSGKIGGDSDLAPEGVDYARCLTRFINAKREEWDLKQLEASKNTHFPPLPGDSTPPNPYYHPQHNRDGSISDETTAVELAAYSPKPFCVWTSMLKRSIQTAQFFDEEAFDTKQMRMLDELNAGVMEGLTYSCISTQFPEEYRARKADKLHYRYPGPGGEGYLDIINRMRPVIVELERMTDHVLLVGHRSVARVLLAYFRGLRREEVADLDVPIGLLYCLEPKPYGVDFKVYKWDKAADWFSEVPDFKLKPAEDDMQ